MILDVLQTELILVARAVAEVQVQRKQFGPFARREGTDILA